MTAAVNNDAGVIGLAAVLFYLQVRFLVRAPEIPALRWGILMAVVAGCLVFTKPQGFAMLPGCAIVCAWIVAKNLRERSAWIFAAVTAACTAVLLAFAFAYLDRTGQTALINTPSAAPSVGGAVATPARPGFLTFLSSLDDWYQVYLFRSFFGQFGWLEYSLPPVWIDRIRSVWTIVEVGAVAAIVLRVMKLPGWRWLSMRAFLFCGYTALFTVAFILFAEHRFRLLGIIGVIQGRNMLLGLPALGVVAAACFGALVPARFRTLSAAALATCALCLHVGSILLILRYHYGS